MAVRNILKGEDPGLRKIARPVAQIDMRVQTLVADMIETMKAADGIGLAAPQVGILRRVIVVDVGQGPMPLINPQLMKNSGEQVANEGCLSLPGIRADVCRPMKVSVCGFNPQGEKVVYTGTGLFARVICHELDHLEGVLFTDHVKGS